MQGITRNSLGAKIIIIFGMILILVLSIITFLNFSAQKAILLERGIKEANALGDVILTGIRYPMLQGDQDIIQQHFNYFQGIQGIKSIHLLDHQGTIKRSTDIGMVEKRALSAFVDNALLGIESHGIENVSAANQKVFTEAIPIFNENRCFPCHGTKQEILGVLDISLDWEPVLSTINDVRNLNISVSLIGLIGISISVILIIMKMVVDPILIVEQGLKKVSEGNLAQKLPAERNDEIGSVSRMFNQMTEDISDSVRREKELRQAEQLKSKELEETIALINATLESTADGILVVNNENRISRVNQRFLDIWEFGDINIRQLDAEQISAMISQKLTDNHSFSLRIDIKTIDLDRETSHVFRLQNGKIIEIASRPQKVGVVTVGRVWSFRDITEQKNTEDALQNKMNELERFNRFVVGREIKMKQLKEQIADLRQKFYPVEEEVIPEEGDGHA